MMRAGGVLPGGSAMSGRDAAVVTLLAVAMLAAGCIDPGDPAPPKAYLSVSHLESRTVNNTTVWDCTFNVTRVTPEDVKLSWAGVKVAVKSRQGALILPADVPGSYQGQSTPSPKAYRVEGAGSWLTLDAGDAVRLASIDESFLEASLELEYRDSEGSCLLVSARLPSTFP